MENNIEKGEEASEIICAAESKALTEAEDTHTVHYSTVYFTCTTTEEKVEKSRTRKNRCLHQ